MGCGDPTALLELRRGQVVLDLGSGAGGDCFRAADRVGRTGRVIGVDMTPAMIARARSNARSGRFPNVEFRLGEIEHLPVPDRSVDVVLSNCVLNLVPDKAAAYREAFRVLRPGGHLAVSDLVALRAVAPRDRADLALWSSCSSGAVTPRTLRRILVRAGFSPVTIEVRGSAPSDRTDPGASAVVAADIRANRPRR
ncbi:MAG TPA: methyltransferase domain-containing protein [Thermoplasmata archaeon]|nr:methyltransferase domain-containing protein [Thermoplasmata archaeon]